MRVVYAALAASLISLMAAPAWAQRDSKLDAPPAGLVPTTARLADILAAHDKVANAHLTHDTVTIDWSFVDTGLNGTEHLERSGTDYHSRITTGAYTEEFGQQNGKRWHLDQNGFTSPSSDLDDRSFLAVRVLEDAADPKNDVTVLGQTTDAKLAYVLQVKRPGYQHPEWIYYDAASGNIVRVETIEGKHRIVGTYDDFRTVDGVTQAWHVHDAWWDSALDDDWHITSFRAGMAIAPSTFAMPAGVAAPGVAVREKLPVQFVDGYVIIRLKVGDRGLDFELDSSQAQSLIDRGVADQLQLPTFGQSTRLTTGAPWDYWTRIPNADAGPVHLHNFAVVATDFAYNPSFSTKVVGVLGYDFLASNVVRIDYVNSTVEVIPNKDFASAAPVPKGLDLPFKLDDGVPLVPMQIGSTFTDRVIVNCDLPITLVFGPFVAAHSDEFRIWMRVSTVRSSCRSRTRGRTARQPTCGSAALPR